MKRTFLFATIVLIAVAATSLQVTAQLVDRRTVHAFLAKDEKGQPVTAFPADTFNIYLIWKGDQLQPGDEIRVVWMAEDLGSVGQESKIGERSIPVHRPNDGGSCFISRPKERLWPVGKYRAEVAIGKRVIAVLRFNVQAAANAEAH